MVTRVPVLDVHPQVEGGRFPAKAVEDEELTVRARVVGEGRAVVGAAVVMCDPDGRDREPVPMVHLGEDRWAAAVTPDSVGSWTFRVESWHDPLSTWTRDAPARLEAEREVDLTLAEGAELLRRATTSDPAADAVAADLLDADVPAVERLATALAFVATLVPACVQDHLDTTAPFPLLVDRERALVGAWYQLFPRSEGAEVLADGTVRPGTLRTTTARLEAVAAMGFDVVCLAPLHPIGTTGRLGADGSSPAGPDDVGSPWAVGSTDGGHDVIDPALGTSEDLTALVERAHQLGMEVALDLTLLCSPDHPWVTEHPEWFRRRPDGTLAPSGTPDVVRLDVDDDPVGVYLEVLRVITHWMDHGIRVLRIDRAHAWPPAFWQQLITDLRGIDPDVVLQAGPGAAPAMLEVLGTIGFHQSVTAFTDLESPPDVAAHLVATSGRLADVVRPAFWVSTPEHVPPALRQGDPVAFGLRAALAATGSPSWGVVAGFEDMDDGTDPSPVYAVRAREQQPPASLAPFLTRLNTVRRAHPALRRLRNLAVHRTDQGGVLAFSRATGDDVVLVVIDLYPAFARTVGLDVRPEELGLAEGIALRLRDELDGSVHAVDAVALDRDAPVRILVPLA